MDNVLLSANGHNCLVELLPDRIRIARHGASSFLIHGMKGEKEIFYSDITSVQFKHPGTFTAGYMQLSFAGGMESKKGLIEAVKDENSVIFHQRHLRDFELLKVELNKRIAKAKKPAENSLNSLFELEKLAELKEKGILTEDEFTLKKHQILNNDSYLSEPFNRPHSYGLNTYNHRQVNSLNVQKILIFVLSGSWLLGAFCTGMMENPPYIVSLLSLFLGLIPTKTFSYIVKRELGLTLSSENKVFLYIGLFVCVLISQVMMDHR